jgi:hypothetical protein
LPSRTDRRTEHDGGTYSCQPSSTAKLRAQDLKEKLQLCCKLRLTYLEFLPGFTDMINVPYVLPSFNRPSDSKKCRAEQGCQGFEIQEARQKRPIQIDTSADKSVFVVWLLFDLDFGLNGAFVAGIWRQRLFFH